MAVVFKNPNLTDYFIERNDVRRRSVGVAPILHDYEAPKIITFPALKFSIDHDYWATTAFDGYPLKKLSTTGKPGDPRLGSKLAAAGMPWVKALALRRQIDNLCRQVLPVYEQLFAGYAFIRTRATWRLNTIHNENLHVDTYDTPYPHFARLFINLDREPRIWQSSYTFAELFDRLGKHVLTGQEADGSAVYRALNKAAFGGLSAVWWDNQPRHVIYFAPGDVWCVDSRQIAHQIFYGRRAVSFDFLVDPASMVDPNRYYLTMAEGFRDRISATSS